MSYRERIFAFFRFAIKSARKAASLGGDVVYATSTPLTIALPAVYVARKRNIPMVFEVRDLWPELPIAVGALKGWIPVGAARWLERFAYKNSNQIVVLSPGMKKGVLRTGYPDDKVHVVPNSADLELFDVPKLVGQVFREHLDWLQDRPLVVYTGTMGMINGVDYLARLAAVVKAIDSEIRFLVVGKGKKEEQVCEVAKRLGVLNRNFFVMGPVSKADVPEILSAADIATSLFIDLPEMWANSANKFFDALASGTPVAINYQGWQAKLLRETGAGLVLDARDLNSSAERIAEKLRDSKWLESAGTAARQLAETKFSRDKLAQNLEDVLMKTIESD
jgi:glycosyltransferase involved in cell wall biosynthesis